MRINGFHSLKATTARPVSPTPPFLLRPPQGQEAKEFIPYRPHQPWAHDLQITSDVATIPANGKVGNRDSLLCWQSTIRPEVIRHVETCISEEILR
jgi:hypothetical protein